MEGEVAGNDGGEKRKGGEDGEMIDGRQGEEE